MGNFTGSEIITILVVILIVFGPHRLPELARKAGALAARARAAVDSIKTELDAEYGEVIAPLKEAQAEIQGAGNQLKGQITAFGKEVGEVGKEIKGAADATAQDVTSAGQGLKGAAEKAVNQIAASNAYPPQTKGDNGSPEGAAAASGDVAPGGTTAPDGIAPDSTTAPDSTVAPDEATTRGADGG